MCDRDESLLEKQRRTETPTRCDDLHSKIDGLSKNSLDAWTSDCDKTQHLDTCSSPSVYIQQELRFFMISETYLQHVVFTLVKHKPTESDEAVIMLHWSLQWKMASRL